MRTVKAFRYRTQYPCIESIRGYGLRKSDDVFQIKKTV